MEVSSDGEEALCSQAKRGVFIQLLRPELRDRDRLGVGVLNLVGERERQNGLNNSLKEAARSTAVRVKEGFLEEVLDEI